MADQGKVLITMTVPASTARGTLVSGAGTKSATLRAVGVMYDSSSATETIGPVQIHGTALVLLGATLAAGAVCMSDAAGAAIAVVDGSEELSCCILLEGGDSGELRKAKIL